jgi:hypothetical protein
VCRTWARVGRSANPRAIGRSRSAVASRGWRDRPNRAVRRASTESSRACGRRGGECSLAMARRSTPTPCPDSSTAGGRRAMTSSLSLASPAESPVGRRRAQRRHAQPRAPASRRRRTIWMQRAAGMSMPPTPGTAAPCTTSGICIRIGWSHRIWMPRAAGMSVPSTPGTATPCTTWGCSTRSRWSHRIWTRRAIGGNARLTRLDPVILGRRTARFSQAVASEWGRILSHSEHQVSEATYAISPRGPHGPHGPTPAVSPMRALAWIYALDRRRHERHRVPP